MVYNIEGYGNLVSYRKLTIIHVPVGKCEGDDVITCGRDVEL